MPFLAPIGIALGASAATAATVGTIATVAAIGGTALAINSAKQGAAAAKASKAQNAQIAAMQAGIGNATTPNVADANSTAAASIAQRRASYTQTLLTGPQGISGEAQTGKTLLGG